ncbi:protein of unknown function [Cupriavidus taiwanensis]|uniref:Uncharacterized protein n=1 Tax=Cupriavidus taiwanensis TaxID=164546 RepID=A0A375IE09_9BURK|nr:hypothetical protein CBM2629_A70119 [Cupriavidus taiwanensis]SPK73014.1 protein of unknown function [Cupriavidus taiwanensis]
MQQHHIGQQPAAPDRKADVMVGYASGYADQAERDYDQSVADCRSGRLEARTDADMAADFRV